MRQNLGPRNGMHDKNQPTAVVPFGPIRGPVVEPFGREHCMLGGLHNRWAVRQIGKAHNPLDPEQVGAALARQAAERAGKVETARRCFENHPERVDAVGVSGDGLGSRAGNTGSRGHFERGVAEKQPAGILSLRPENAAGASVEGIEPADEVGAERNQIGPCDHQGIGECRLSPRLGEAIEAVRAVYRVDEGDDARQMQGVIEHGIGTQGEQDRCRIGESGGFDNYSLEAPYFACSAPLEQAAQGTRKILADRTAQTAAGQFENASFDKVDEVVIDRDLAELIDDDSRIGQGGRDQRASQERRLAAAEKSGQHGRRQSLR